MAEFKNAEEMLKNYTTHGCFVVAGERPNVMTASWGFFGEMWGKKLRLSPCATADSQKVLSTRNGNSRYAYLLAISTKRNFCIAARSREGIAIR